MKIFKCNGAVLPLHKKVRFAINSDDFIKFRIEVTSNRNGAVAVKNGKQIKSRIPRYFTSNELK